MLSTTSDPKTPAGWAIRLSQLWGKDRFPVDVRTIALDFSKRYRDPVFKVVEADIDRFEGALVPLPKKGGWAIVVNPNIESAGRINYTLGHELGHYLNHRHKAPAGFECGSSDVLGQAQNAAFKLQEREADQFASYLLMPLDDFRRQIDRQTVSLDLLRHCADRYQVSLTAAALKWLEATPQCAAVVVATNGFVKWFRRSYAAERARLFFQPGMELPIGSIAARGSQASAPAGVDLSAGVWCEHPTREIAIFADQYEMTISLLVIDNVDARSSDWDDEAVEDSFDRMTSR